MLKRPFSMLLLLIALVGTTATTAAMAKTDTNGRPAAKHVLLLSVDGLHQSDLSWYVDRHPSSALAQLVRHGVEFAHAQTPFPSDSFPGMVGQVTGGNPKTTGIYYDDSWNRTLLPAGTTSCAGVTPGVEVTYFEQADRDPSRIDAGQGLTGLPGGILQMTGDATSLLDPNQLPVDPGTCTPVRPHQYLKVNTVFEVARVAGLRTAWADKHVAYEILNGPSGTGIQDLFAPEINSNAPTAGASNDWTTDNALTMQYDNYKVQAVLNEINGYDHSGTSNVGTPAIFGMNFQTVSTAEKLPTSDGLTGGYLADGVTPGPLLQRALDFINVKVATMTDAIKARHLQDNTVIILSAKHGQSPQTPSALTRIADGPIIAALNAAWTAAHPGSGNDINSNPKPYISSGLARIYAGSDAAAFMGVPFADARVPDIVGIAQYGVVYTGKKKKIAEHGGDNPQDRDVPLVLSGNPIEDAAGHILSAPVETTQIAPTILQLLGLDPSALKAVQIEQTAALPVG